MANMKQWIPLHRSKVALVLSWLAPVIFMGIGYLCFPSLRLEVKWPWNASEKIWSGLFVQLILVLAWIVYEIWYATHRNTSIAQLQADAAGDITVTLMLLLVGAGLISLGIFQWWFLVPMLGSIIDLYLAPVLGINNAAEKPFFSARGSI